MLLKNERCIKMYMHEKATFRTSFTWAFLSALLPPLYVSSTDQPERSRDWGGYISWVHPLGWRQIRCWEPLISWNRVEMLQLCDGNTFAGIVCPLSGQSDSGNIMEVLWARVHLAVFALGASLRAPQRTSPWSRAARCFLFLFQTVLCPAYSFCLLLQNKHEGRIPSSTSMRNVSNKV